jgi:MATE family multidrug resistance protein
MLGSFTPSTRDLRALLGLAVPIVVVHVGFMLMSVVGTTYLGHVSATELAAGALGNLYVVGLASFGIGTLWAVDPIVSQALGARDHEAAALGVQRGLVLGVVLTVAAVVACLPAGPVFQLLRQPAEVVPRAQAFVHLSAPSMAATMLFVTLRQSLQAMKRTRGVVLAIVVANIVNLLLHEWLVSGRHVAPGWGANGSALAIAASRFTMLAALLAFAWHELAPVLRPWRRHVGEPRALLRTLRIGLPIGVQNSIEYITFALISVFAGWFGAHAIGGHQVAINLASLMYMVPLGVGSAASVLVGRAIGERDLSHARRVAASAILCGASFMALSACALLAWAAAFARAMTSVADVIAVATALIPIAGLFQVFDGVQVVSAGALRGAGDTRAPVVANVLGFWLIGIPVSLLLGFRAGLGVTGLWWGFVAGLAAVAVFLVMRVRRLLSRPVERVWVDTEPA